MTSLLISVALVLGSYIVGSIPTAYIIVKAIKKIDIRTVGSGNVGATNVGRVLGFGGFLVVLFLDALKGFLPLFLATYLAKQGFIPDFVIILAGVAVILGHTFTIFLKFKGGKGVATSCGVFLALAPLPLGIAALVFGLVVGVLRMVSAGSVLAALALAIAVTVTADWLLLIIFTWVIAIFVIYKHIPNIKRIIEGKENKIGKKA